MNVQRTFVAVIYGLVIAAFLPIGISGEVGWLAPILFVAAMIASLVRDPTQSPPRPRTAQIWTGALIAVLLSLVAWSFSDGNWLLHSLQFALLLVVSRFFQRRFSKDYLQLTALSFVMLLVAAIISPGPTFALCFLSYSVLLMWGLTLLHVVREIEVQTHTGPEHLLPIPPPSKRRWFGLRKALPVKPVENWPDAPAELSTLQWRTRRLVTKRYLTVTASLSLGVLAISALFFFLFPRLGMGFFFARTRGVQSVTGFGTDAELGHFGQIKTSAEVVARVTFPAEPERLQQSIRLRGISFDKFAGSGWTRSTEAVWDLRPEFGKYRVATTPAPQDASDRVWRAEIYLEPLGLKTHVLFAPPQTMIVELLDIRFDYLRGWRRRVSLTPSGDLSFKADRTARSADTAMHYAVEVIEPTNVVQHQQLQRADDGKLPDKISKRWLDLPNNLDPRIGVLAKKLALGKTNRLDQVLALERGLRTGWTYSLAGDQDATLPLEDFLFGKKRGHCEYFATSMALMLRSLGQAARVVHGYVGGVYNPYGQYRMIRQGDAHSWVEVYFPELGWQTFDPTPTSGQLAPADESVATMARQLIDSASLLWYQWVVEYDLERQLEMLKSLSTALSNLRTPAKMINLSTQSGSEEPDAATTSRNIPWPLIISALVVALLAGLWWRRQQLRASGPRLEPVLARAVAQLRKPLQRLGIVQRQAETWAGLAQRISHLDPGAGALLREFANAYDVARYAPAPDASAIAQAAQAATRATVYLRTTKKTAQIQ